MKVKLIDKMGWFNSSPANSYLYKKLFIPGDIVDVTRNAAGCGVIQQYSVIQSNEWEFFEKVEDEPEVLTEPKWVFSTERPASGPRVIICVGEDGEPWNLSVGETSRLHILASDVIGYLQKV